MAILSEERLREIRARVEKATAAPWHWEAFDERTEEVPHAVVVATDQEMPNLIARLLAFTNTAYLSNADFIVHAREDIPDLLAAYDEALKERERLRELAENLAQIVSDEAARPRTDSATREWLNSEVADARAALAEKP